MKCLYCKIDFIPYKYNPKQKFCGHNCYYKYKSEYTDIFTCLQCNKIFYPKKVGLWKQRKFCSLKCSSIYKVGKKQNMPSNWYENWKKNPGGAKKGRQKSEEHKKKIGLNSSKTKHPEKSVWNKIKFAEQQPYEDRGPFNLLGVDNDWTNRVRAAGIEILTMEGLYCWHTYRLLTNTNKHLL